MTTPKRQFDLYDIRAFTDAGNHGGEMLDGIGETDLAKLTPEQYDAFIRAVIAEYGASLRRQIGGTAAPF